MVARGRHIEILVGHLTFVGLLRREFLACFSAVYLYMQKYQEGEVVLAGGEALRYAAT